MAARADSTSASPAAAVFTNPLSYQTFCSIGT